MKNKYNIFISYRRDGGEYTAKILRDQLCQLGYQAFFDVESLRSGDFNMALYDVIEECQDFILVLSPGALDRCENEDDWVRQEIVHALKEGKNIVPVMLRDFQFPEKMPEEIEPLRYKNGLPANSQFFDAFIEKLEGFLQSKPRKVIRWKKALPVAIATIMIVLAVTGALAWNSSKLFPYPRTKAEKNLTGNLLYYVETNLQQIEVMAECMNQMYETCERQLTYEDAEPESFSLNLRQYRSTLQQMDMEKGALSQELESSLQDSPFSAADAAALYDLNLSFQEEFLNNIYYMEYLISNESLMGKSNQKKILDNYRSLLEEELKTVAYGANEMLLPIKSENALEEFKQTFLPQLRYIPLTASNWNDDEKELQSDENNSYENMDKVINAITALVGETNMAVVQEKARYIQLLIEYGCTAEEAEEMADAAIAQADKETEQLMVLQEKIKQMEGLQQQLDQAKEEVKEEFAPAEGDSGEVLWGKMLRFLSINMYDEALVCVDAYREAVRTEDKNAEQYAAAAAQFIRNIGNTGIDYGMVVVDYVSGEDPKDPRKIGDIIIAIDGKPCHNLDEYGEIKESISGVDEYTIVVLRNSGDGSGTMEQVELTIPMDSQKLYLYNMTEKSYE